MFQKITMIDYSRPLADRAKSRKICGPYCWNPSQPMSGRGFYQASDNFLEMDGAGSTLNLRLSFARDSIPSSRSYRLPLAYFCDEYQDCSMTPVIARLPHSRGFLAGWTMGAGMYASLEPDLYDDEETAALAAFDIAESAAEMEREYQETHQDDED